MDEELKFKPSDPLDPARLVENQDIDARKWAESFMDRIGRGYFSKSDIDVGLMTAWFANAIMVGRDYQFNSEKES